MTWQVMSGTVPAGRLLITIVLLQVVAPAALTLAISELMRSRGWIRPGDTALAGPGRTLLPPPARVRPRRGAPLASATPLTR